MAKMLRQQKQFGRCTVPGHNRENCEVCQEIQNQPISRAQDKREWQKQAAQDISE